MNLPDLAKRLIDSHTFATIATINPDGSPQNSVIWVKREDDTVVFSTILGRRKTRNMERDPRVSILLFDPQDPYKYVEIRGMVSMTKDGGPELIEELSQLYDGKPFTEKNPANVRVVCRVTTTKVVIH
ncbi:PPOX class F420-dependent oxidoreductase [Allorhizocola rhizosphaerae]|uniref:PPOX class F420-dependent oxidoreductase n=1 Tax=Allorhizocola rhizosphaerae TaxID=1872709 RepID=UPI000E3D3CDE|nr:PPOX class F420-dependent oxidoreductase [Allorhizocola rhizosphaerae]